jgi:hypothetical protein
MARLILVEAGKKGVQLRLLKHRLGVKVRRQPAGERSLADANRPFDHNVACRLKNLALRHLAA